MSAIRRCAAFERSWVRANDVTPWTSVAASTAPTRGRSSSARRFPTTSSIRNFVEPGRTSPATRFTAMRPSPASRSARRGRTRAQRSGTRANSRSLFGRFGAAATDCPSLMPAPLPRGNSTPRVRGGRKRDSRLAGDAGPARRGRRAHRTPLHHPALRRPARGRMVLLAVPLAVRFRVGPGGGLLPPLAQEHGPEVIGPAADVAGDRASVAPMAERLAALAADKEVLEVTGRAVPKDLQGPSAALVDLEEHVISLLATWVKTPRMFRHGQMASRAVLRQSPYQP